MGNARVVADGGHGCRDRGGDKINAGGVGAARGGLVARSIGNTGRVTQALGISQRAAIAVGPGGTGDRGTTQEGGAVVNADGFTGNQGSGEAAADR